jgi:hypothetical protein
MKYIMLKLEDQCKNIPVIFPDILVHAHVAAAITRTLEMQGIRGAEVISAGSIDIVANGAGGESETLSIESRGERDVDVINQYPYSHGIEPEESR